jgi:methylmalonyl-CoA epimerase
VVFIRIDHIGIAVHDLDTAVELYTSVFGCNFFHRERVSEQGMEMAMLMVGDLRIELMEPISETGVLATFMKKHGPGIHHVAYEVNDIGACLQKLRDSGLQLVDQEPRRGAENALIAFIHPKSTDGVLIEICEKGSRFEK